MVLNQPFRATEVVVGFWTSPDEMTEPWYFIADAVRYRAIGGGYWSLGLELKEFANVDHGAEIAKLRSRAERLFPAEPVLAY